MNKIEQIHDQDLQIIIDACNSISQILNELKISKSCGHYRKLLKDRMKSLDCSKFEQNQITFNKYDNGWKKYNDDDLFCENSLADHKTIKSRYALIFPQTSCSICKLAPQWNNKILNFHLDHINGINSDNRISNLRWICPNCHSQTDTYTGRNKFKKWG